MSRILVDIGHPAHFHLFKNLSNYRSADDKIYYIVRDKDVTIDLFKKTNLNYSQRHKGSNSLLLKPFSLIIIVIQMLIFCKKFKIEIILSGPGGPYTSIVSKFRNIPSLIFDDTDTAILQLIPAIILRTPIITPNTYRRELKHNHYKHNSLHELSYLPKSNEVNNVKKELGISETEKIILIRFVSWTSNHDIGHQGISLHNKFLVVSILSRLGKVFISSEKPLPDELNKYKFPLEPNRIHNLMAVADLFFGESATMASESAILGTPAIYFDNAGRCYTDELESQYGLVFNFDESQASQIAGIKKAVEILSKTTKSFWQKKSKALLNQKEDMNIVISNYISDFINN